MALKQVLLLGLLGCASAARFSGSLEDQLQNNASGPVGVGIQAVSQYAAGNCQFAPLFDVAHFMMEAAPAAAEGAGMMIKPALTTAVPNTIRMLPAAGGTLGKVITAGGGRIVAGGGGTVVSMASRSSFVMKFLQNALRLTGTVSGAANPLAQIALQIGFWQLRELQKALKDPKLLAELIISTVPPYSTMKDDQPLPFVPAPPPLPIEEAVLVADEVGKHLDPALVLAAGAVLLISSGALAMWQQRMHNVAYDQAICPSDRWLQDPALFDWRMQAEDDEDEEDEIDEEMEEISDNLGEDFEQDERPVLPMPRCNGLRPQKVTTQCGDDLSCRHRSCQQACCSSKKTCSMYQFDVKDPSKCWLGEVNKNFNAESCEQWMGEKLVDSKFEADKRLQLKILGAVQHPQDEFDAAKMKACHHLPSAASSDLCTRLTCEDLCMMHSCKFFQFKAQQASCWFGFEELAEEAPLPALWHGGTASDTDVTGCPAGHVYCSKTQGCMKGCRGCSGATLEGSDGRCKHSAEEAICNPKAWSDKLEGVKLNATQCKGLKRDPVKIEEKVSLNGLAICRERCCADPNCVLYQVRQSQASNTEWKPGSKVHCWLGMQDSDSNRHFSCPASNSGWKLDRRAWAGEFLEKRGCSAGFYACLLTNECVASCSTQCPGATETDSVMSACMASDILAASDKPILEASSEASYFIDADIYSADTLLMISQNRNRFKKSGESGMCAKLSFNGEKCQAEGNGCSCKYPKEQTCSTWFKSSKHLRPVVAEEGLVLLSGEGCVCKGKSCDFTFLTEIPAIKLSEKSDVAVNV